VSFSLATGAAIGMKSALAASTEVANPAVPTRTSSVSEGDDQSHAQESGEHRR
jgi:hypothetical protein